jgi:hypothetical protein
MKRVPKSFDASVKQVPKHLMLDKDEDVWEVIDEETMHSEGLSNANDDLLVKINRLQVSSGSPRSSSAAQADEISNFSSSQNSADDSLGESKMAEVSRRSSSKKKKKKKADEDELLASIAQSNWQEEDELLRLRGSSCPPHWFLLRP